MFISAPNNPSPGELVARRRDFCTALLRRQLSFQSLLCHIVVVKSSHVHFRCCNLVTEEVRIVIKLGEIFLRGCEILAQQRFCFWRLVLQHYIGTQPQRHLMLMLQEEQ